MNYRAWQVKQPDEKAASKLAAGIGAPRLLARILVSRGISDTETAMAFLQQDTPISDPFLIKDMDKAVERILKAVDEEEPIVIFGDYDVDGVTATAILYQHLCGMGANVRCKLPSRDEDGYGLSLAIVETLAEKGFKLLITVDNGVSAFAEVQRANELGLDVVITDHHLPPAELPPAIAVVNPARTDDTSPFKSICGAEVAFKLCAALDNCPPEALLEVCGDLVAIGTIADVMPLVGENRTIVRHGLHALQNCERPGLLALLEQCGLADKPITAESVSFLLAPRINAAGRMESAAVALQLLLCEDDERAEALADRLTQMNIARQEAEQHILEEAEAQIAAQPSLRRDRVLVVWGEGYHSGVIGIVASRLMERYGKPVLVISLQNGEGRGSGRSVAGFHLHSALTACQSLLTRYGGHAMAAGFSVEQANLEAFRKQINAYAAQNCPMLEAEPLQLDVAVQLDALSVAEVEGLDYLAPCGNQNPAPLFFLPDAVIDGIYPVSDGRHTRLRLRQGATSMYAAYFGISPAQVPYAMGQKVDVALSVSVYEGKNGKQFSGRIREIRPAGLSDAVSKQVSLYRAFADGMALSAAQKAQLLPSREDIVALYRTIQTGGVFADDMQPLFASLGAQNTGKIMVGLKALAQIGLITVKSSGGVRKYAPVAVTEKRDLFSAPILRALEG